MISFYGSGPDRVCWWSLFMVIALALHLVGASVVYVLLQGLSAILEREPPSFITTCVAWIVGWWLADIVAKVWRITDA